MASRTASLATLVALGCNPVLEPVFVKPSDELDAGSRAGGAGPRADAGGPYSIAEGERAVLDASASTHPSGKSLRYAWDLDGDGTYGDATGVTPSIDWTTLARFGIDDGDVGGTEYTVGLEVRTDGDVDTTTTTIVVTNTAPILETTGAATVSKGGMLTLQLRVTDPGDDTVTEWTLNWGDGAIDKLAGNPSSAIHVYAGVGLYAILASAVDEDGRFHQDDLLVTSENTNTIKRYQRSTGAYLGEFGGSEIDYPSDLIFGADGLLYLSNWLGDTVTRYRADASPGGYALADVFVGAVAGSPGLGGIGFGPDGNLYATSSSKSEILRFSSTSGALLGPDPFDDGSAGAIGMEGLLFPGDGYVYVTGWDQNRVVRFDSTTGVRDRAFDASGGGLAGATDLTFGPDGNLYVTGRESDSVARFNGSTGAALAAFVAPGESGLDGPVGLKFGPDGLLYVASHNGNEVLRYDGRDGTFVDAYVPAERNGSLSEPNAIVFIPGHQVAVVE